MKLTVDVEARVVVEVLPTEDAELPMEDAVLPTEDAVLLREGEVLPTVGVVVPMALEAVPMPTAVVPTSDPGATATVAVPAEVVVARLVGVEEPTTAGHGVAA